MSIRGTTVSMYSGPFSGKTGCPNPEKCMVNIILPIHISQGILASFGEGGIVHFPAGLRIISIFPWGEIEKGLAARISIY